MDSNVNSTSEFLQNIALLLTPSFSILVILICSTPSFLPTLQSELDCLHNTVQFVNKKIKAQSTYRISLTYSPHSALGGVYKASAPLKTLQKYMKNHICVQLANIIKQVFYNWNTLETIYCNYILLTEFIDCFLHKSIHISKHMHFRLVYMPKFTI